MALVQYYKKQSEGLCVSLKALCLITENPQTVYLSKEANEAWEIDRKSIRLGTGQSGEVRVGIWNGTTEVAVKIFKTGIIIEVKEILEEVALMKKSRHPNFI